MSSSFQFLSRFKQATQSLASLCRPWSVFFDRSYIDLPSSISDATTRIAQNLTHFRLNYSIFILALVFWSVIYRPLSILAFFITLVGWIFLYFARDEPLTIAGHEVNDWVVLSGLFAVTAVVLIWSGAWFNVGSAIALGSLWVLCHSGLRSTDDLLADYEMSPYGDLLADDDDDPRGAYTDL